MVLVEFTLNYNHVKAVLGPGGRIYFPSQLIPMIIGAFTLCRVIYKRIEKARDPDEEPEEGERTFGPLRRISSGKDAIKIFAPLTYVARPVRKAPPKDTDLDERMENEHLWIRYVVSIFPWLSLLPRWDSEAAGKPLKPQFDEEKKPDSDRSLKTLSATSDDPNLNYKVDFSNEIPDGSFKRAMSRFSTGGIVGNNTTVA